MKYKVILFDADETLFDFMMKTITLVLIRK